MLIFVPSNNSTNCYIICKYFNLFGSTSEKPLRDFLRHDSFEMSFDSFLRTGSSSIKNLLNFGSRVLQVEQTFRISVDAFFRHFSTIDKRTFLLQYRQQIIVFGQNLSQTRHDVQISFVPKTFLPETNLNKCFFTKLFSTFAATSKRIP